MDFSSPPEPRDTNSRAAAEAERELQRTITERLLLTALRAEDAARSAIDAEKRATFLVSAGRELAMALDQDAIRDIVRRSTLPRAGSWCIVDIIESNGAVFRLAVVHPDSTKQALASALEDHWDPAVLREPVGAPKPLANGGMEPRVITPCSGAALIAAARGERNLEKLRAVGFGELVVVPLAVRDTMLGTITFVTREGDASLSAEEIALAASLADRCAIALDHARLYAQADELRAAADVANRAKSMFLGNMTHELLTPLNAIGGYAELMEMGLRGPVTPQQCADLERIKRSQVHLVGLIRGILEYVRSENGSINYGPTRVPVLPLLREAAEMLTIAAGDKRLAIRVIPSGADAVAMADPIRVRQILVNLVTNAVKYSAAGSGDIVLSCAAAPHVVNIRVSDEGSGIPAGQTAAIFQPFVQLASGLSDRQGGVGLGLAISRDLAIGMKGQLTVQSTVGVGSEFTLTLPRAEVAPA